MEHALPRRTTGAPRTWSLCMTSENHGTVGPAGCTFSHAPDKHERVLVVEVPAAAGAPVDQVNLQLVDTHRRRPVAEFKGYVDGEPAVTWLDRDNMPRVGTKLFAGNAPAEVEMDAGFLQWLHDRMCFVHGENENVDYMHKLRAIIASVPDDRKTPNVASTAQQAAAPGALDADEMTRLRRLMAALGHSDAFELTDDYVRGILCTLLGQAAGELERASLAAISSAAGTPEAPKGGQL